MAVDSTGSAVIRLCIHICNPHYLHRCFAAELKAWSRIVVCVSIILLLLKAEDYQCSLMVWCSTPAVKLQFGCNSTAGQQAQQDAASLVLFTDHARFR